MFRYQIMKSIHVWHLFSIREQEIIQQPSSWSQLYSRSNPTFRMQLLMIWISKPLHHFTSKSISCRVFMSYKISVFILSSRICELFSLAYSNLPSRICIKAKGILALRPNCLLIQTLEKNLSIRDVLMTFFNILIYL